MARKLVLVVALLAGPAAAFAATQTNQLHVVTVANNPTLGKKVLMTPAGRTLYSLSVERHGRWICVKSCLGFWKPLVIAKGKVPAGAASLGTVKRPDGRMQVTFKSGPLYTFTDDHAKGDAKGEGFKDVGVWHAAVVGPGVKTPQPTTTSSETTTTTTSTDPYRGGG